MAANDDAYVHGDCNDLWREAQRDIEALETTLEEVIDERNRAEDEVARLKEILDSPDAGDFVNATATEARYQLAVWGDKIPVATSFGETGDAAFLGLVDHLAVKVVNTPDENLEKKLHRITTVAAAAANWHQRVKWRASQQKSNSHVNVHVQTTNGPDVVYQVRRENV